MPKPRRLKWQETVKRLIRAEYPLTDKEVERIKRPITGQGGWQGFQEDLRQGLDEQRKVLRVTQAIFEFLVKHAKLFLDEKEEDGFKRGGWQDKVPLELKKDALGAADKKAPELELE